MIRVQTEDFDPGGELRRLTAGRTGIGGACLFVGLVRDMLGEVPLQALILEHYPGMTERALARIEAAAHARWPLSDTLIIHRVGRLAPGDQIVLVAAVATHRDAAFEACRFLIDWLKTEAPLWKREETATGTHWVEANAADQIRAERWLASDPAAMPPPGDERSGDERSGGERSGA